MRRKDTHLPQFFADAEGVALAGEPAVQPVRPDVLGDGVAVAPRPGQTQGAGVQVGGEDLHLRRPVQGRHVFAE